MSGRPTNTDTGFRVCGLCCKRGSHQVLSGVDMDAQSGQIVGLVGANGAGKTTLFDVVCGLRSAGGKSVPCGIHVDRIAYLTQSITVPDALRLGELAQLVFGLSDRMDAKAQMACHLSEKELAKLTTLWDRRSNSCSYGEKRWFVLIIVLSTDADLYVLDEPTSGVDIEYRQYIWNAVRLIKQRGKIVIFSKHAASEIEDVCDHFYFLKDGRAHRFDSAHAFLLATNAKTLDAGFMNYLSTHPIEV